MIKRRGLLRGLGGLSAVGALGALGTVASLLPRQAYTAGEEFRVLVVVLLEGGNDGHNVLVPTNDSPYADYLAARSEHLALPRNTLLNLPGTPGGRSYGMHAQLQLLLPLYQQQRLAFVANVGPLMRPVSAAAVLSGQADVPPLLGSHKHQSDLVQGGLFVGDSSGWGGRALEALPPALRHSHAAIALGRTHRLVHGREAAVSLRSRDFAPWWSMANLRDLRNNGTQAYLRMAQQQHDNPMRAEYARTLAKVIDDSGYLFEPFVQGNDPPGDWGNQDAGAALRRAARLLPFLKQQGVRRHVIFITEAGYDHHRDQLNAQRDRMLQLGRALSAFDDAVKTAGLDNNVATLVMSEFGRTLRPSGGTWTGDLGSEHGWGNHWMLMGGPVLGGTVHGSFPSLVLGGADDGDPQAGGRLVPTTSSDQVAASLVSWLGVPAAQLPDVFPQLVNFQAHTLPLMRA